MSGGDTWLVNVITARIWHVTSGPEADALEATGWKAFPTQAAAKKYASESLAERDAGYATGPDASALKDAGLSNPLTGLDAIGNFFNDLDEWTSSAGIWRLAKITLGGILLLIGINKLTGASTKIDVIADKIPKVVPV